jgi:hypothetical protein
MCIIISVFFTHANTGNFSLFHEVGKNCNTTPRQYNLISIPVMHVCLHRQLMTVCTLRRRHLLVTRSCLKMFFVDKPVSILSFPIGSRKALNRLSSETSHSHTHSHLHSQALTRSHTHTHSLTHTHAQTHTHTFILTHSHIHSHTHTQHSLAHTRTLTLTHTHSHLHTLTLTHTPHTHAQTHSHTYTQSHTTLNISKLASEDAFRTNFPSVLKIWGHCTVKIWDHCTL